MEGMQSWLDTQWSCNKGLDINLYFSTHYINEKWHSREQDFWVAKSSQVANAVASDLLAWLSDLAWLVAPSHHGLE
jgi:acyl-CoA thioesterase